MRTGYEIREGSTMIAERCQGTMIRTGRLDPIAYTYEADYHCPQCAERRFGTDAEGWIPADALDQEGNLIGAVAPWDEWQQFSGERETLNCADCGEELDEYIPA